MTDLKTLEIKATALLGRPAAIDGDPVGGGNNQIYRLAAGGEVFALKVYLHQAEDRRDRLGQESNALQFLADNAIACVPRVHGVDRHAGFALYDWLVGVPVVDPTHADVEALLSFAADLKGLTSAGDATDLVDAQASCFSAAAAEAQLRERLARLTPAADGHAGLKNFLDDAFRTAVEDVSCRLRDHLDPSAVLPRTKRTLSPSDFGFHNALRRKDGALMFLDFEYFGWDDPVKMTADILLHRGAPLSNAHRRRVAQGMVALFQPGDEGFTERLRALYPLYGLIWCMIALNEFLPERWARRVFAGQADDHEFVLKRQLRRAETLIHDMKGANDIDLILG